jgi:excisionase family DNA binding protein
MNDRESNGKAMQALASGPVIVQTWPLLLTSEMAAMYLSVTIDHFEMISQNLHLQAVDVGDGVLRWDRRDLDERLALLPKVAATTIFSMTAQKGESRSIDQLAQAVAEKLGFSKPSRLPSLVSIRAASERLGIGRTTIYKLISRGDLQPTRIGRRTLIPVAQIERVLAGEI